VSDEPAPDEYTRKLHAAMWELHEKGIRHKQSQPIYFRVLHRLRVKIRPPHYSEPKIVFIYTTIYFTVLINLLLWFVQRDQIGMSLMHKATISVFFGALFGGIMMVINIQNKKKFELTPWDDL